MIGHEEPRIIHYLLAVSAARDNGVATFERLSDFMHTQLGYTEKKIFELYHHTREKGYIDSDLQMHHPHRTELLSMINGSKKSDYEALKLDVKDYLDEFLASRKAGAGRTKVLKRVQQEKRSNSTPAKKSSRPNLGLFKIEPNYEPLPPPSPIFGTSEKLVTLKDLTTAIRLSIDPEMEYGIAEHMANHVLGFFGYQATAIDNSLEPEDRNLFYMLQDYKLIGQSSEETTLPDGRDWRIHYWILNPRIHELVEGRDPGKEVKTQDEAELYKDIFTSDLWTKRGTTPKSI